MGMSHSDRIFAVEAGAKGATKREQTGSNFAQDSYGLLTAAVCSGVYPASLRARGSARPFSSSSRATSNWLAGGTPARPLSRTNGQQGRGARQSRRSRTRTDMQHAVGSLAESSLPPPLPSSAPSSAHRGRLRGLQGLRSLPSLTAATVPCAPAPSQQTPSQPECTPQSGWDGRARALPTRTRSRHRPSG